MSGKSQNAEVLNNRLGVHQFLMVQEIVLPIRPEHRKTFPNGRIPETLLMFIRLRGGAQAEMDAALACAPLADYFELSEAARAISRSAYYTNDPKPGSAWDTEVQLAANELKKDGYAVRIMRAGRPIWQLTPNGVVRADFWLSRMKEKAAALKALTVDAQLASLETVQSRQALGPA